MALTDGTEHARLREAVTEGLAGVNRHRLRRYITRYAVRLIDGFVGEGKADLVADFALKLPAFVVAHQLGIPESAALSVGAAVSDMISGGEAALAGNQLVVETVHDLVESRKLQPGDDLASRLLAHPQGLTDEEVRQHLRLVLVGALEPTANLIANTLRMILTDSRFRGNLSGGQMTLPDALEQVLWDHPPLAVVPTRWATCDIEVGGTQGAGSARGRSGARAGAGTAPVLAVLAALADGAGAGAGAPAGVLVPGAERRERLRPHPALRPRFRNRWRGASRCSCPCCRPGSR